MTTLREAAQQALEALDEADTFHRNLPDQRARRLAAMAALRAALAQQDEPVEPVATLTAQRDALLEALKEMLEYAGIIEERCDTVATNKARAVIVRANLTKGAADD